MTKNQLEYWKLRWNQHYQHVYLQQEQQKIDETKRSNLAREEETKRHNKAEERIATQRNVLTRIELDQNWARLTEQMRSNYVHDLVTVSDHLATLDNYMAKNKTMEAELFLSIAEASDQSTINYAKAAVEAYSKAVDANVSIGDSKDAKASAQGKGTTVPKNIASFLGIEAGVKVTGAAAVAVQLFNQAEQSGLSARRIRDNIMKMYPQYVELFGPDAGSKFAADKNKYVSEHGPLPKSTNKGGNTSGKINTKWDESPSKYVDQAKRYVDSSYDQFKSNGNSGTQTGQSTPSGTTVTHPSSYRPINNTGPGVSSNTKSSTSSGTKVVGPSGSQSRSSVIISPGARPSSGRGPGV